MSEQDFDRIFDSDESVTDSLIDEHIRPNEIDSEVSDKGELSTDEVVIELMEIVPKHLKSIGLLRAENISPDDIETLVAEGYTDKDDIENLYLSVWGEAISKLGPFTRAKFDFMLEKAEMIDAAQLEAENYERAILQFEDLAIDSGYINPTSQQRRSILRLSWLFSYEPKLSKLSLVLRNGRSNGSKVDMPIVVDSVLKTLNESVGEFYNLPDEDLSSIERLEKEASLNRLRYTSRLAKLIQEDIYSTSEN